MTHISENPGIASQSHNPWKCWCGQIRIDPYLPADLTSLKGRACDMCGDLIAVPDDVDCPDFPPNRKQTSVVAACDHPSSFPDFFPDDLT